MKIPERQKAPAELAAVFTAEGGLNCCDEETALAGDQAAKLVNFWYDGGKLSLRPGLARAFAQQYGRVLGCYPKNGQTLLLARVSQNGTVMLEKYGIYILTEKAILTYDGSSLERVPDSMTVQNGVWVKKYADYSFRNCALFPAGDVDTGSFWANGFGLEVRGSLVYLIGDGSFLLVGPHVILDADTQKATAYISVAQVEPTVPTVRTGCTPLGDGTEGESRNLLTPKAAQSFTTDGKAAVYRLADQNLDDAAVEAALETPEGDTLSFLFGAGMTTAVGGSLAVTLDRQNGTLTFSAAPAQAAAGQKDNLRVTYSKSRAGSSVFGLPCFCSMGEWLGGAGGRLFLAGNPDSPGAVFASAAGNALYFPEDGILSPGDPNDAVTAFGWFYDRLIVFKNAGIYAIEMSESGKPGVSLVNAGFGCDAPESVALAGNRLAFVDSAFGVCALSLTETHEECDVVCVSRNIGPALAELASGILQGAFALSLGGRYYLFAGTAVFLWDFARRPLAASGNARALAWYRWELPREFAGGILFQGSLLAYDDSGTFYGFDPARTTDDSGWFSACFRTATAEFGSPLRKKTRHRCWFEFDCDGRTAVWVTMQNGAETKRLLTPESGCGALRCDPDLGRAAGFWAEVGRVAGDGGALRVGAIRCTAVPGSGI